MKYIVQEIKKSGKNAGSKAVRDVIDILLSNGYQTININGRFPYLHLIALFVRIKANDTIVLQWPFYGRSIKLFVKILVRKKIRLILLLHDINSLRKIEDSETEEKTLLSYAEKIIIHTNAMKLLMVSNGVDASKMRVLSLFDYLTNDRICKREYSSTIVYAGNLSKSIFLQKIPTDCFNVHFNCYGLPSGVIPEHLTYKGAFVPENVSVIEGSWGLVWDGDSVTTCSGNFGEYLKINSPHKTSLYIVAGLPIIIWKYAALAEYVTQNKLGITIESLEELSEAIASVSKEQYEEMLAAIDQEAKILKTGGHIMKAINF